MLPMLCTPTICNVAVTKTLIDGGAGLNLLSVEAFSLLHVPLERLDLSKPFSGVGGGAAHSLGQIRLPVTFGECKNYRTELIDFDVAHIRLPYNAILGYPTLAKFMAVTHHGYNVLKMPGSEGIITVPCEEGMWCAPSSAPFKPQQSTTPTAEMKALRRPSPRRRSRAMQDLRRMASRQEPRQDQRPLQGRLPPSHRKARQAPSLGRARGLSSGGPLTLPTS